MFQREQIQSVELAGEGVYVNPFVLSVKITYRYRFKLGISLRLHCAPTACLDDPKRLLLRATRVCISSVLRKYSTWNANEELTNAISDAALAVNLQAK
jgi:hypothetical protein